MMLISLNGCGLNTHVSNFCVVYEPVYWVDGEYEDNQSEDSEEERVEEIRIQIDRNNLAYDELCLY